MRVLEAFDGYGSRLATADTQGSDPTLQAFEAQGVQEGHHDTAPG